MLNATYIFYKIIYTMRDQTTAKPVKKMIKTSRQCHNFYICDEQTRKNQQPKNPQRAA